ncbi:hypothetical protein KCU81_g8639, partial [Aureobasidium melanogenum]|uniref:Uncharacterized protein n=1 Tax=Aureobasidium melanogenum (strain CBS 110374) TaxID=1043003 RepID=A0A074W1V0_AURM1
MSPSLRSLIRTGKISDLCLRRKEYCHHKISDRDYEVAGKILGSVEFQDIRDDQDYNYEVDLWTLARCSFCSPCQKAYPKRIKDYHKKLRDHLAKELEACSESDCKSGYESGYGSGFDHIKTEPQRRKERRSCHPNQLEKLAKQIKSLERQTDGFKREISDLKQELKDERNQHQDLKHQHAQMIEFGEAKYAAMIAEAETKFAELMRKIAGSESQNLWIQEQMRDQQTIDHQDMAKMIGTIKEMNAGLAQCYGEQYKVWLTPTSRHVVTTLEPM